MVRWNEGSLLSCCLLVLEVFCAIDHINIIQPPKIYCCKRKSCVEEVARGDEL